MANREYKIPHLDPAVDAETKNGEYRIKSPIENPGKITLTGKDPVDVIRLNCQSLIAYSPDTLVKCNSCVKTIISGGSGDQVEIIECGKCRTSYLVRTQYDSDGKPKIDCAVWDISRNVKNYCFATTNSNGDFILRFNDKNHQPIPRVK